MAGIGLNRSRQAPAEKTPSFGAIAERFRRAGDLDRAIALCLEGLKKFPNQLSARVTLGWALLDKGEYEQARQELERVIRRAPDNLAAIRGLAELHDRAEHAVTGLGPDGVWTPPDDVREEPSAVAAVPAEEADVEGAEIIMAPSDEAMEIASSDPLPPLSASVPGTDIDPRALIETPAQAAVAHAGAAPATFAFEAAVEVEGPDEPQAAAAMAPPPEAEEIASSATRPIESPVIEPVAASVSTEPEFEEAAEWAALGSAEPAAAELDPAPVLIAENAEAELARMASELAADAGEPAADVVLDMPAESGLEEFEQFEALPADEAASEAVELVAAESIEVFDHTDLDSELPLLERENAAPEAAEIELVSLNAEAAHEAKEWAGLTLVKPAERDAGIDEAALEGATAAATDALENVEPDAEAAEAHSAPAVAEPAAQTVPEDIASGGQGLAALAGLEGAPQATQGIDAVADASPVHEPGVSMFAARDLEAAREGPNSAAELEDVPVAAAQIEAAPVAAMVGAYEATPEDAPSPSAALAALVAASESAEAGLESAEAFGRVQTFPAPAGVVSETPEEPEEPVTAAAASVRLSDGPPDPPPTARARTPEPAPVAALEGFLRKISARRLHLTPDSVA
jgi:tetratricopeptide (TPR) repeat protein